MFSSVVTVVARYVTDDVVGVYVKRKDEQVVRQPLPQSQPASDRRGLVSPIQRLFRVHSHFITVLELPVAFF